jgi:hypothetical protein
MAGGGEVLPPDPERKIGAVARLRHARLDSQATDSHSTKELHLTLFPIATTVPRRSRQS